jgi:hypothetical protein
MNTAANTTHTAAYAGSSKTGAAQGSGKYLYWRICAWAGPIFLVGYLCSWGILGFNIPPFEPSISMADLQAHYVTNSLRIRIAFVLSVFFMPFYFVFSAVLSRIMQKIEGTDGPLSIVEQMGGAVTTVVGLVAGVAWLTAAFRVDERTPEMIRQLHDFGWLFFDTTYMVTSLQMIAVGLVALSDKRKEPLFPRWLAWYSIFVALVFVPLTLLPFFYNGPFAWSGLFNYWVGLGNFFVWVIFFCYYVFKAIDKVEQEDTTATP